MLTLADITAIESAARAATPGPWVKDALNNIYGHEEKPVVYTAMGWVESLLPRDNDAAYIAAANPAVVLHLCEAIRELLNEISAPCHGCITDNSRRNKDSNFCGLCSRGKLLTEYGYPIPEREATP